MLTKSTLRAVNNLSLRQRTAIMLATDGTLVPAAFVAAVALHPRDIGIAGVLVEALPRLLALVLIMMGLSLLLRVAQTRLRDAFDASAVRQVGLVAVGVALAAALMFEDLLPSGSILAFGAVLFLLMFVARTILYEVLTALYRRNADVTRVVIYGAGATGLQLASALRRHHAIQPVAFVDDNVSLHGLHIGGLKVHAPLRLPEVIADKGVRRVILAMPSASPNRQQQIARRLEALGLDVQTLPSFAQLVGEDLSVDKLKSFRPGQFLGRAHRQFDPELVAGPYRDRVVMVTGAGGTIGRELCRQVMTYGPRRLVLLEMSEPALFNVHRELSALFEDKPIEIVPVLGSVTEMRLVRNILRQHGVQIILHAAAYKHVPMVETNIISGLANNVLGTNTLAREAAAAGVERFILVSSDKAVRPANVMGASKRLAEMILQDMAERHPATHFAAVRFGNVIGSSGSVVQIFREQIAAGGPVTLTDEKATRYFMTAEEAVHLVLIAATMARHGEIFALDMGEPVLIRDLARRMIVAAGYTVRDAANPDGDIEVTVIGPRRGDRRHEPSVIDGAVASGRHPSIYRVDPGRLSEFELATILRGIREAVSSGEVEEMEQMLRRFVCDYRTAALDSDPGTVTTDDGALSRV